MIVEAMWLQTVETSASHLVQTCHGHNSVEATPVCTMPGTRYMAGAKVRGWCNLKGFCSPQTTWGTFQTQQRLPCSPHKAQAPGEQPDKLRVPLGSMLATAVCVVNQLQHGRGHVNSQGPLLRSPIHLHATSAVPATLLSLRALRMLHAAIRHNLLL